MAAFLVDECVSSQTIQLIKSLRLPVESLQDLGRHGATDEEVLRLARERRSTLVTYDRGFGYLSEHRSYSHSGIIVVKVHDAESLERCHLVLEKLLNTEAEFEGTLFIVDRNKYRKRRK